MIKTETIVKNGKEYVRTYSDANMKIRQNNTDAIYSEAIDPIDSGRTYTETDQSLDRELSDREALEILTGGVYGNEIK
jgi:hypothetical protein